MEWKRFVSLLLTCAMLMTLAPAGIAEDFAAPTEEGSAVSEATSTAAPTSTPTPEPTQAVETQEPTQVPASTDPTAEPTATTSSEPSAEPTATASSEPSAEPSETPATGEPTAEPTEVSENTPEPTEVLITALRVDGAAEFTVAYGTPEAELKLPGTLTAALSNGNFLSLAATWACVSDDRGGSAYDRAPSTEGDLPVYTFRAQVADTQGYALAEGVDMPTVTVKMAMPDYGIAPISQVDVELPEGMKYDDGQSRLELGKDKSYTIEQINAAIAAIKEKEHTPTSVYSFATISGTATLALPLTNNGTIESGTFSGEVTNNGSIKGGTFSGAVTNNSSIESGTFGGTVTNHAAMTGGIFNAAVTSDAAINGGTFNGAVTSSKNIIGGTFNGSVTLNRAYVAGGTFNGSASIALQSASGISGGDFYTTKIVGGNGRGATGIYGGTFHVELTLNLDIPTISGGTFLEPVTIPNGLSVLNGTFKNTVTNSGTVRGGTFDEKLVNNGAVKGDGKTPTINGVLENNKTVENAVFGPDAESKIINNGTLYVPVSIYGPSGELEKTETARWLYNQDALTALNGYTVTQWKLFVDGKESDLPEGYTLSLDGSKNHFKHNSVWRIIDGVLEVLGDWDGADAPGAGTYKSVVVKEGVTLSGGTFSGAVTNNGTISGGTFNAKVTNMKDASITNGTFNSDVVNQGAISNGTFSGVASNGQNGTISGGTFSKSVTNSGAISGGVFNGADNNGFSVLNDGTISGGTFSSGLKNNPSGKVTAGAGGAPFISGRLENAGTIENCTATQTVINTGTIKGGSFTANNPHITSTNNGSIEGGTFEGQITNSKTISGGTFSGTVTNSGTISNGTFSGTVANNSAISGGTFEDGSAVTNASGADITDGTFSGTVTNNGTISGGTFSGTVTNSGKYDPYADTGTGGEIKGGAFSGEVESSCLIGGGSFSGEVTNRGKVSNGTFSGTVNNEGGIYSSTFEASSTLNNRWMVLGSAINGTINTKEGSSINEDGRCTFGPTAKVGSYAPETIYVKYYILNSIENLPHPSDSDLTEHFDYYDTVSNTLGNPGDDKSWYSYPYGAGNPAEELVLVQEGELLSLSPRVYVKASTAPYIGWPAEGAPINYGETLSKSTLTGTPWPDGTVHGTFVWSMVAEGSDIVPTVNAAKEVGYEVVFTPSNPNEYVSIPEEKQETYFRKHVTFTVNPFKLTVAAKDMTVTYNSADTPSIEYTVNGEAWSEVDKVDLPNNDEIDIALGTFAKDALDQSAGTYTDAVPLPASVTVKHGSEDYTEDYTSNYEITCVPGDLTIEPKPISEIDFSINPTSYIYSGQPYTPTVSATDHGSKDIQLLENVAFVCKYQNNVDAGTAKVTMEASSANPNYTGETDLTFTINPSKFDAELLTTQWTYNGTAITPGVSVTLKPGGQIAKPDDYTVTYPDGQDNATPGKKTVTVVPKTGNLTSEGSTASCTFTITKSFDGPFAGDFEVTIDGVPFSQENPPSFEHVPGDKHIDHHTIVVTDTQTKITLKENEDYTVSFDDYEDGRVLVTITGAGVYSGTLYAFYTVKPKTITEADVTPVEWPEDRVYPYTGEAHKPEVKVTVGGVTLTEGTDYIVEYFDNTDAGDAYLLVYGIGHYTGRVNLGFKIAPADINDATLSPIPDQIYTGSEICPEITLTFGKLTLTEEDYTIASYENNVDIGKATVTITGKGDFEGSSRTDTFNIIGVPLTAKMADPIADQAYTGKAITPEIVLKDGDKTLKAGEDYTVAYKNNTAAGTATVVVTAKEGSLYSGSVELTFAIVKSMTDFKSDFSLEKIPDQTHTGTAITPKITLKDGDKTLKEGTDYTLSYENNVKVGTATVKITGKGAYSGTLSTTFTIKAKPASSSGSSSSGSSSSGSSSTSSTTSSSSETSFIGDDSYTPQEQLVLYGLGQASDLYADDAMESSLSIVFDDANAAQDYDLTIVETPAKGAQPAQNALLVQATEEAQAAPRHLDLSLAQANRLHNGQHADLLIFRNGGAALSVAFEDLFGGDLAKLARLALDGKLDDALNTAQGDLAAAIAGLDEAKLAYSELAKVRFALHLDPVFGPDGSVTGYEVCALLLCGDAALDVTALLPTLRLLLLADTPEGMRMELTDADGQTTALDDAVAGALLDTDRKNADQYEVRDHASDVRYEKASSLSELLQMIGLRVDVTASGSYRLTAKQ